MEYSLERPPSIVALFSRGTGLCDWEISCTLGRSPGPTWGLATWPGTLDICIESQHTDPSPWPFVPPGSLQTSHHVESLICGPVAGAGSTREGTALLPDPFHTDANPKEPGHTQMPETPALFLPSRTWGAGQMPASGAGWWRVTPQEHSPTWSGCHSGATQWCGQRLPGPGREMPGSLLQVRAVPFEPHTAAALPALPAQLLAPLRSPDRDPEGGAVAPWQMLHLGSPALTPWPLPLEGFSSNSCGRAHLGTGLPLQADSPGLKGPKACSRVSWLCFSRHVTVTSLPFMSCSHVCY